MAALLNVIAVLLASLIALVRDVSAGQYCYVTNWYGTSTYKYCTYGCCSGTSDGCCAYTYIADTVNVVAIIVGCTIGGIVLIAIIITVVCCVCCKRRTRGQVMQPAYGQPGVTIATTSNNMAMSGQSAQYPTPAGNPWYPPTSQPYGYPPQHAGYPPQHAGYPPQPAGAAGHTPQPGGANPPQPAGYGYPSPDAASPDKAALQGPNPPPYSIAN